MTACSASRSSAFKMGLFPPGPGSGQLLSQHRQGPGLHDLTRLPLEGRWGCACVLELGSSRGESGGRCGAVLVRDLLAGETPVRICRAGLSPVVSDRGNDFSCHQEGGVSGPGMQRAGPLGCQGLVLSLAAQRVSPLDGLRDAERHGLWSLPSLGSCDASHGVRPTGTPGGGDECQESGCWFSSAWWILGGKLDRLTGSWGDRRLGLKPCPVWPHPMALQAL